MDRKFFLTIDENLFSDDTHKNNCDSDGLTNSCLDSNETFLSLNNTENYVCQNITLDVTKNKKDSASFCLNLMKEPNKENFNISHNYTQNIILHSLKDNLNPNSFYKISNKGVQHIVLKSLKKNEEIRKSKNDNNENISNNSNNSNMQLNSNNIIRVILSNEKVIKNFPMEYFNEMMYDLCTNLYNSENIYEKIRINQRHFYNHQQQDFFDKRMSLFNFILYLTLDTYINEATLFLTYDIFDRYCSNQPIKEDESQLFAITSFAIAIKYIESTIPNLDELCCICGKAFNKEQINKCELILMEKLNYNISIPTIYDLFQFVKVIKNMNVKDYNLGLFILEMYYIGGGALKYNALIVIEAIYLIILETNGKEKRNLNLYIYMANSGINITKYNEEITSCLLDIKKKCIHIKEKNFSRLIKKFASEKYQKISVDFQLI